MNFNIFTGFETLKYASENRRYNYMSVCNVYHADWLIRRIVPPPRVIYTAIMTPPCSVTFRFQFKPIGEFHCSSNGGTDARINQSHYGYNQ